MTRRHAACLVATAALAVAACATTRRTLGQPALRVGVPVDYAPFAAERDGTIVGLDVDVARGFAADAGRKAVLVPFRWPDLTRDLVAGHFDVAMGGVTM